MKNQWTIRPDDYHNFQTFIEFDPPWNCQFLGWISSNILTRNTVRGVHLFIEFLQVSISADVFWSRIWARSCLNIKYILRIKSAFHVIQGLPMHDRKPAGRLQRLGKRLIHLYMNWFQTGNKSGQKKSSNSCLIGRRWAREEVIKS